MTRDEAKQALADMQPALLRVAARIIRANGIPADDAVQDAYLKALRLIEADKFPQERDHLFAWFTRVVHSAAYDALRSHGRRNIRVATGLDQEPPERQPGPLQELIDRDELARIDQRLALLPSCISQLPSQERSAVQLRFQGVSSREIALALGVPVGSLSALFRSAYQQLRLGLSRAPVD